MVLGATLACCATNRIDFIAATLGYRADIVPLVAAAGLVRKIELVNDQVRWAVLPFI
jgi:hypothetical protein